LLVVTIDLVPAGNPELRRTIGTMRVANVSGLADVSDYAIDIMEAANPLTGTKPRNASCAVEEHDRRQSIWVLLAKAAQAAMQAEFDDLCPAKQG
jgi:hypothetical protein